MTPVRLWIGLVLLALGVIGVLEATGAGTGGVGDWWPIAVIGLGLAAMIGRRRVSVGPLLIVALGAVLLADRQEWTTDNLFVPALLVVLGLVLLFGLTRSSTDPSGRSGGSFALFSATKVVNRSEHLKKTDATAVFGGVTLDLREARIDDLATVDAFALFGGVDILVPRGWRISMTGTPILGGFDDKTRGDGFLPPDAPVLRVDAIAVFGGVTVANEPSDAGHRQDQVAKS